MSPAPPDPTVARTLRLPAPHRYHLARVVRAHGWWNLPPFRWHEDAGALATAAELDGHPTDLDISQPSPDHIAVDWTGAASEALIAAVATRMLMLEADFTEFQWRCARRKRLRHVAQDALGRMLRSPTLWEDVVKVLCTTNVNWAGTRGMVGRLVHAFGARTPLGFGCFPNPERLARARPATLARKARLGYRAGALSEMARSVVAGDLHLADWEDDGLSTTDLHDKIMKLKGLGPYAAASILALLCRYDSLPVDSAFMSHVSRVHFNGERPTRARAERVYRSWGRWKYLAYWFER